MALATSTRAATTEVKAMAAEGGGTSGSAPKPPPPLLAAHLLAAEDQRRARRLNHASAAQIFAGHHAAWMEDERRLLTRAAAVRDEVASLRARLADAEADAAALRALIERLKPLFGTSCRAMEREDEGEKKGRKKMMWGPQVRRGKNKDSRGSLNHTKIRRPVS